MNGQASFSYLASKLHDNSSCNMVLCMRPHGNMSCRFTRVTRGADTSLDLPTSRCILFDGENISFDASLVIYLYLYIYKQY